MSLVFFYGLFMDKELLESKGFHPENFEVCQLKDYQLQIGNKATLKPQKGSTCFGSIMELSEKELAILYSDAGVKDYVPQSVTVVTKEHQSKEAQTYLLSMDLLSGRNSDYAKKLQKIAQKLKLPDEYIHEIKSWI